MANTTRTKSRDFDQYSAPLSSTFFRSKLGWMGLLFQREQVVRLTFGHDSQRAAISYLNEYGEQSASTSPAVERLVAMLKSYAAGEFVEFDDVPIDFGPVTHFQRRVLNACREIDYGSTQTYQGLAVAAGSPRAARAVGNIMASNRLPLIVPCHRVVGCGNSLGGFSAPSGLDMKRRLLDIENVTLLRSGRARHGDQRGSKAVSNACHGSLRGS